MKLNAKDFAGVLAICNPTLPFIRDPAPQRMPSTKVCLANCQGVEASDGQGFICRPQHSHRFVALSHEAANELRQSFIFKTAAICALRSAPESCAVNLASPVVNPDIRALIAGSAF